MALPLRELGALVGAGAGSIFPVVGTAAGGFLGGALGSLGDWYFQEPDQMAQQQGELAQQQFDASRMLLNQMQNPNYEAQDAEERLNFERNILPQIAQQFGSRGALGSSAFENALVRGREDLATRLAALRQRGELSRQGLLGNYLTGQQNIGLNLLGLGQRQQGMGIQGLNNIGSYNTNIGQMDLNRRNAPVNAGLQYGNQALGHQAQTFYNHPTSGYLPATINAAGQVARGMMGG